jgi:hypothetical protein
MDKWAKTKKNLLASVWGAYTTVCDLLQSLKDLCEVTTCQRRNKRDLKKKKKMKVLYWYDSVVTECALQQRTTFVIHTAL